MATPDIDAAFERMVAKESALFHKIAATDASEEHAEAIAGLATGLGAAIHSSYAGALSARSDFGGQMASWVQYSVDGNVISAIAEKVGLFMDALEGLLAAITSSTARFDAPPEALLLPCSDLIHILTFLSAAAPSSESDLVRAILAQVEEVVYVEECVRRVLLIEAGLHRAGSPTRRVPLADLARAFIREGDIYAVSSAGDLVKRHIWLFTDLLVYGFSDADYGGWGVEKSISLATMNIKPSSGARNSFALVTPEQELMLASLTGPERDNWYSSIEASIQASTTGTEDTAGDRLKKRLAMRPTSPNGGPSPSPPPAAPAIGARGAPAAGGAPGPFPMMFPGGGAGAAAMPGRPAFPLSPPPSSGVAPAAPSFGPVGLAGLSLAPGGGVPGPMPMQMPGMMMGGPRGPMPMQQPQQFAPPRPMMPGGAPGGFAAAAPSAVQSLPPSSVSMPPRPSYGAPPRRY